MSNKSYLTLYAQSEERWNELRKYLETAVELADTQGGGYSINYDKNTVLQILFKMNSMEE